MTMNRTRNPDFAKPVATELASIRYKLATAFVEIESVKSWNDDLALQMLLCLVAKAQKILATFDDDSKILTQQVLSWAIGSLDQQIAYVYETKCPKQSLSTLIYFICNI